MRSSGILMPVFSLPSPYGIGTLGKAAYDFVDFLKQAGQSMWQILPLTPTGYGDSPYQSCSSFAGNHYLIDLDTLVEEGLLKEAEKNQDLKLAIIDMRPFLLTYKGQTARYDAYSRKVIDALPFFSLSRFDAINRTQEVVYQEVEGSSRFDLSFFLTFIKYHSKWEEDDFSFDELQDRETENLGFLMHQKASLAKMKEEKKILKTDERMDLYPLCEQGLYELLGYVEDKDYEVLFLNTPHYLDKTEAARLNTLCDILDKEGYAYANYEFDPEVYSFKQDFYNDGHTNFYGAEKFTSIFGEYLKENYDFPDRREDENCDEDWDGVHDKMKQTIAQWEEIAAKKKSAGK